MERNTIKRLLIISDRSLLESKCAAWARLDETSLVRNNGTIVEMAAQTCGHQKA
jgi:hypothetical protein